MPPKRKYVDVQPEITSGAVCMFNAVMGSIILVAMLLVVTLATDQSPSWF